MEAGMRYLAKVTTLDYRAEKCVGCGRCVEVCPHGVFAMQEKLAVLTDRDQCMECGACAMNCEFGAITVSAGVGCASAIITGMLTGQEPSCGCDGGAAGGCC
jgi:NAD-dependent dihydropyrimidine dehydrogenase PreA subunit